MFRPKWKKNPEVRQMRSVALNQAQAVRAQRLQALRDATNSLLTHDLSDEDWKKVLEIVKPFYDQPLEVKLQYFHGRNSIA